MRMIEIVFVVGLEVVIDHCCCCLCYYCWMGRERWRRMVLEILVEETSLRCFVAEIETVAFVATVEPTVVIVVEIAVVVNSAFGI